jgi:lysophospholipid hydrolase
VLNIFRIEIRLLSPGDVIMTEDSHNDAALIHILSGSLNLSQNLETDEGLSERTLFVARRGECVGQLAMLTGEANFYTCKALEKSYVAILTQENFFEIVCESPAMVLSLAHSTIASLSPLVRQVDFALDWITIESGKALFRQGDKTDGTYIVLSGRFRSVIQRLGAEKREIVDEYSKGEMVGLVDVITGNKTY